MECKDEELSLIRLFNLNKIHGIVFIGYGSQMAILKPGRDIKEL